MRYYPCVGWTGCRYDLGTLGYRRGILANRTQPFIPSQHHLLLLAAISHLGRLVSRSLIHTSASLNILVSLLIGSSKSGHGALSAILRQARPNVVDAVDLAPIEQPEACQLAIYSAVRTVSVSLRSRAATSARRPARPTDQLTLVLDLAYEHGGAALPAPRRPPVQVVRELPDAVLGRHHRPARLTLPWQAAAGQQPDRAPDERRPPLYDVGLAHGVVVVRRRLEHALLPRQRAEPLVAAREPKSQPGGVIF